MAKRISTTDKLIRAEKEKNGAIQLAKSTALNKINKIYTRGMNYTSYGGNFQEQRDSEVSCIIDDMNMKIKIAKVKYKARVEELNKNFD